MDMFSLATCHFIIVKHTVEQQAHVLDQILGATLTSPRQIILTFSLREKNFGKVSDSKKKQGASRYFSAMLWNFPFSTLHPSKLQKLLAELLLPGPPTPPRWGLVNPYGDAMAKSLLILGFLLWQGSEKQKRSEGLGQQTARIRGSVWVCMCECAGPPHSSEGCITMTTV